MEKIIETIELLEIKEEEIEKINSKEIKKLIEKSKSRSKKKKSSKKTKKYKKREVYYDSENLFWENQGNNFYRVFGDWKCNRCTNKWSSAYTWIILEKWEKGIPISDLIKNEFVQQECKRCKNKENKLLNGKNLERKERDSDSDRESRPHKRNLCAKCKRGNYCDEFTYQM